MWMFIDPSRLTREKSVLFCQIRTAGELVHNALDHLSLLINVVRKKKKEKASGNVYDIPR
jgi:hypothetical protein